MSRTFVAALLSAVLVSGAAFAEEVNEVRTTEPEEEQDVQHDVSLTFSPVHLIFAAFPSSSPFVEVTGEVRVADKFGVAGILGGGKLFGVFSGEVGAQARWYPIGSFIHGLSLAAEAQYLFLTGTPQLGSLTSAESTVAHGFSVSPMIGYKIATNSGFTFDVQAGPAMVFARASAANTSVSDFAVLPNVNLNLGWSF